MYSTLRPRARLAVAALITGLMLGSAQAAAPLSLIAQGDQQWAAGQFEQAQTTFELAIKAEPRSVPAHMKLAGLQLSRQEFKACIATYQRTIGLDANNAKAWLGLGFAYLHTTQNDLSLAAFKQAIRIEPANQEKLAPVLAKLAQP